MQLADWLQHIEQLHAQPIDLTLERVQRVAEKLQLTRFVCPVVTIGGTNGKGSCVALLEAIYRASHYRVGAYTSPQLLRFTDQLRINGTELHESAWCDAFQMIEQARGMISLTLFEFTTLAALYLLKTAQPALDIILLEVGLGGKNDAVNVVESDAAVLTSIALDHQDWLGNTREEIGAHKAGIFRAHKPAICGDSDPPASVINQAAETRVPLYVVGRDFHYQHAGDHWDWFYRTACRYRNLPLPKLDLVNAATVLMVITALEEKMATTERAIVESIQSTELPGRFQVFEGDVTTIFDVAHNLQACNNLARKIRERYPKRTLRIVLGMLKDKDICACVGCFKQLAQHWYIAGLDVKRGAAAETIKKALLEQGINNFQEFAQIKCAYLTSQQQAESGDVILVFGSFITVAAALALVK